MPTPMAGIAVEANVGLARREAGINVDTSIAAANAPLPARDDLCFIGTAASGISG